MDIVKTTADDVPMDSLPESFMDFSRDVASTLENKNTPCLILLQRVLYNGDKGKSDCFVHIANTDVSGAIDGLIMAINSVFAHIEDSTNGQVTKQKAVALLTDRLRSSHAKNWNSPKN